MKSLEKKQGVRKQTEDGCGSSRPVSGVEFEEFLLLLSDCFLCLIAITPMEELHLKANFVFYLRANGFLCVSKICILME